MSVAKLKLIDAGQSSTDTAARLREIADEVEALGEPRRGYAIALPRSDGGFDLFWDGDSFRLVGLLETMKVHILSERESDT